MTIYRRASTSIEGTAAQEFDSGFVTAVYERLRKRSMHSHLLVGDRHDAIQNCILKFLNNYPILRHRYDSARQLADALWVSGPADFQRAERVQRCQGAQLKDDDDGFRVARRQVGPPLHSAEVESHIMKESARLRVGTDPYERIEHLDLLEEVLGPLPALERRLLWLVHVEGCTVTDAAQRVERSRAHASRVLSGVRRQLQHLADVA